MAPGSLVYANQSTGSSRITARAVARRGCLRWLDVDRMKGGAGARLDRGEVKARPSGFPEERPERRNATSGAPGGARAGHTARGAARCQGLPSAFRRSAPLAMGPKEGRRSRRLKEYGGVALAKLRLFDN